MLDNQIRDMINSNFNGLDQVINNATQFLTQDPSQFSPGAWSIVNTIYSIFLVVGLSLLAALFLIEFLRYMLNTGVENASWEGVVKILLKLTIAKMLMTNSLKFLTILISISSGWITQINNIGALASNSSQVAPQLINEFVGQSLWTQLSFMITISPMATIISLMRMAIMCIVYGRFIELFVLTAISPIPIATAIYQGFSGVCKKFFLTYFGICMQGVLILIICKIYGGIVSSISMTGNKGDIIFNCTLATAVVMVTIITSRNLVNRFFAL